MRVFTSICAPGDPLTALMKLVGWPWKVLIYSILKPGAITRTVRWTVISGGPGEAPRLILYCMESITSTRWKLRTQNESTPKTWDHLKLSWATTRKPARCCYIKEQRNWWLMGFPVGRSTIFSFNLNRTTGRRQEPVETVVIFPCRMDRCEAYPYNAPKTGVFSPYIVLFEP